jgi:hypothetical protein
MARRRNGRLPGYIGLDPTTREGVVVLTNVVTLAGVNEGGSLFAQLTGQPPVEIFPASDVLFFYKVVDAEITFEPDEAGTARALVLHQAGQNLRGERID